MYPTNKQIGFTYIGAFFSDGFGIASFTKSLLLIFFKTSNSAAFLTFNYENS